MEPGRATEYDGAMSKKKWLKSLIGAVAAATDLAQFSGSMPLGRYVDAVNELNWVLMILTIETELKLDVPDKLAAARRISVDDFVERVLALPKVEDPFWNLNRMTTMAAAFAEGRAAAKKAPAKKSAARKSSAKQPAAKKSAAKARRAGA